MTELKVAIVTGGYGAIGLAIARQLAAEQFDVVVAGRNEVQARHAVEEIKRVTGNDRAGYEQVDLSRQSSIQALAERWQGPLHVLINNAGATPRRREETPEGIEIQFATNVLGYFWMVQAFSDALKQSAPARVINVASYYAGDLDLDDLEFKRRRYSNGQAYRQSKQANRMLTVALAERLKPFDVSVNTCHPGDVNSKLSNNLAPIILADHFNRKQSIKDGLLRRLWGQYPAGSRRSNAGLAGDKSHWPAGDRQILCPYASGARSFCPG